MRILFVGGGTAGSVTPLIAIRDTIAATSPRTTFLFVGGADGPERRLATSAGINFRSIPAGKWRRYFSLRNFSDLWRTFSGFLAAKSILREYRPDVIVSAGSYVAVPVIWAGKSLGIPSVIHQQDVTPGLANRLCQPAANIVTVAFEQSTSAYPKSKVVWTGNPVRPGLLGRSRSAARRRFGLNDHLPVVLAFGGSTGALRLNQLIAESGLGLVQHVQILHITGQRDNSFHISDANYHPIEFLTEEMGDAYAAADLVVCRAGLSTLTELAALGKPAVVLPIPKTHQEANAKFFAGRGAIVTLDERSTSRGELEQLILSLVNDPDRLEALSRKIRDLGRRDGADRLIQQIDRLAHPRELSRILAHLRPVLKDIKLNEPLAKHTHFKLGGPAEIFATAHSREEVVNAMAVFHQENVTPIILGGGANVVFADDGIRGIVLQLRNDEFEVDNDEIIVGAGMNTGKAASLALQAGLTGLEFIVGIYGTVGGAVRGNAGAFGKEMKDIFVSCEVITPSGTVEQRSNAHMRFGYRDSAAKHEPMTIVRVRLRLDRGDVAAARAAIVEHSRYKREHQPLNFPSAGCMFKNYDASPDETTLLNHFPEYAQSRRIPAWAFIQQLGLSGRRIGDIQISDQHANFFINHGHGTAEHVVMLASLVKQKVRERYGIQLREEVQFIGFNS